MLEEKVLERTLALQQEIRDRQQVEEANRQLERERELNELRLRFFSMASHELRTPLSIIQVAADAIEHNIDASFGEKIHRNIQRIQSSTAHVTQLLTEILEINRAQSGKLALNPEPLDLEAFCRQMLEEAYLGQGCRQKTVFVKLQSSTDRDYSDYSEGNLSSARACVDKKLLRSILINLLSNAMKYSPPDSCIRLELELRKPPPQSAADWQAIFHVRDRGVGISPEDRLHIFEAFHRGSNVRNIAGTGLGLVVVQQYVEALGGSIAFESEVGVGTTFTVTIPVVLYAPLN